MIFDDYLMVVAAAKGTTVTTAWPWHFLNSAPWSDDPYRLQQGAGDEEQGTLELDQGVAARACLRMCRIHQNPMV